MKRFLSVILCLVLALGSVGAFAEAPKWINSNMADNITPDMPVNLKDDFNLAMNKDWSLATKINPARGFASALSVMEDEVQAKMLDVLQGEPQQSLEGQVLQQYYHDFMDMDTRNALGIEPLLPYLEAIESISTLDELTAYLLEGNHVDSGLSGAVISADPVNSNRKLVNIKSLFMTLESVSEYKTPTDLGKRRKDAVTELYQKLFLRCGFTRERIDDILQGLFVIEEQIADACVSVTEIGIVEYMDHIYNPVTPDELKALSPTFPIVDLMKPYTDRGLTDFILEEPDWLQRMNELYTEENLEAFKVILLCDTLRNGGRMLDGECMALFDAYDSAVQGVQIISDPHNVAMESIGMLLGMAYSKLYIENFVTEQAKADVTEMVHQIVDVYRKRLNKADWLGEETRSRAIEKLDKMCLRVAYPDDWTPFELTGLTLTPAEEGGSLLEHYLEIKEYKARRACEDIMKPIDRTAWPEEFSPHDTNAQYFPSDNSIVILGGILCKPFYDPEASAEANLGGIGMVIGHEITHAFDVTGSRYDADGNISNWWTDEDMATFMELTKQVSDYYGTMEVLPGQFINGMLTVGEAVADLGGMSCVLEIASEREGFDYNALFTNFAHLWRRKTTAEQEQQQLRDSHPNSYLRTNITVQQFEEFYKTFDIQPGDGMYLAPEERLSVW